MKDYNRLNDTLDLDVLDADGDNFDEVRITMQDDGTGWDLANVPVLCLFKGQTPSKNMDRITLWNCLRGIVMGFVVTENTVVVNPVIGDVDDDPCVANPDCPGCDYVMDCPGFCDDPPELDDGIETDGDDDDYDSLHDSLYRQGVWTTLENRLHDLMAEWSLAADDCNNRVFAKGEDDIFCDELRVGRDAICDFEHCPRMHG